MLFDFKARQGGAKYGYVTLAVTPKTGDRASKIGKLSTNDP
jgi:hypothetical protein